MYTKELPERGHGIRLRNQEGFDNQVS